MADHTKLALGFGVLLAFSEFVFRHKGLDVFRPVLGEVHIVLSFSEVHFKNEDD